MVPLRRLQKVAVEISRDDKYFYSHLFCGTYEIVSPPLMEMMRLLYLTHQVESMQQGFWDMKDEGLSSRLLSLDVGILSASVMETLLLHHQEM